MCTDTEMAINEYIEERIREGKIDAYIMADSIPENVLTCDQQYQLALLFYKDSFTHGAEYSVVAELCEIGEIPTLLIDCIFNGEHAQTILEEFKKSLVKYYEGAMQDRMDELLEHAKFIQRHQQGLKKHVDSINGEISWRK